MRNICLVYMLTNVLFPSGFSPGHLMNLPSLASSQCAFEDIAEEAGPDLSYLGGKRTNLGIIVREFILQLLSGLNDA